MNYQMAKNQWENTRKRKIGNNTYLTRGEDYFGIRLHSTEIVKFYPNKTVFDSGGWRTVTTKARINELTDFSLWQKAGIWYITEHSGYNQTGHVFKDGITFDGTWTGQGENPKKINKLRKQAQKYSKDFVKALFNNKVPQPSSGDCWYCSMSEVKTGKPLGEITKDTSHIIGHFEEKYYVPSLLVNAIKAFPISIVAKSCIGEIWQNGEASGWGADIAKRQIESSIKRYCYKLLNTAS